jgi:hypothetical protein
MIRGLDGKTANLRHIPEAWTVGELVARYGEEQAVNPQELRFLWSGKQLEMGRTSLYHASNYIGQQLTRGVLRKNPERLWNIRRTPDAHLQQLIWETDCDCRCSLFMLLLD